ncbi:Complex I intermediate-associated protein 30 [Pochonia chlamydosporia 170]|uniref:Complex I intermediate-associated protein 30 n=1 Tax=Pochonia chlamydosporia 170 TaxID=1380566 RepID=A0A179G9A0_METCM|nr:Complex I intermediate-associated protein 30 [Pochonia chlamydosporia 170]OAQ74070.1 Complex I intermediate-associated protein 30 [Pochonia chlamydosporia 170]
MTASEEAPASPISPSRVLNMPVSTATWTRLPLVAQEYEGIIVSIRGPDRADGKKYVLTLKNEILPPRDDGREQSTVSWEADFVAKKPGDVKLRWADFKATYRGREKKDAGELDLKQEGDFELHLFAISAFKHVPYATEKNHDDEEDDLKAVTPASEKDAGNKTGWRSLLCGLV